MFSATPIYSHFRIICNIITCVATAAGINLCTVNSLYVLY